MSYVYKIFEEGEVIYVGQTSNIEQRFNNHEHMNNKRVCMYAEVSCGVVDDVESYYIDEHTPKFNKLRRNKKNDGFCVQTYMYGKQWFTLLRTSTVNATQSNQTKSKRKLKLADMIECCGEQRAKVFAWLIRNSDNNDVVTGTQAGISEACGVSIAVTKRAIKKLYEDGYLENPSASQYKLNL